MSTILRIVHVRNHQNYHTRWPAKWAIKSKEATGKQLKFVRSEDALANVSSKYYGINVGTPNTVYYPLGLVTTPQNTFWTLAQKV